MKIRLHPGQYEVAKDPTRFKVICAGRRWGKSVLSRFIILQWALKSPGLYWIVTPTYTQGEKIHWLQGFLVEIPALAKANKAFRGIKFDHSKLQLRLPNGSFIQIISAENPDRLVGVKLKGLVIDEIAKLRNWNWLWKEALRPTLTDYEAPAIFISTPKGYNHFYELFTWGKSDKYPDYKSWKFTSYDNPYVPHREIDKAKNDLLEDTFQQEYMAEFKKFTGLVYSNFDRIKHVKELKNFKPEFYIRGNDRGWRHPSAVPFIGVDADGVWYQTDEIYQAGLTNPQFSDIIKQRSGSKVFELSTMDSANASDIQDLADLGCDFIPVKKQAGEANMSYVRWKIQKFAERLKAKDNNRTGYYVHPSCKKTIWEFEHYSYPEKKEAEDEKEQPIKLNDHMMDALADLNGMYLHMFEEVIKPPWHGKLKGTYIEPAIVEQERERGWTKESGDTFWEDDLQ
jgi:hypothetical protein